MKEVICKKDLEFADYDNDGNLIESSYFQVLEQTVWSLEIWNNNYILTNSEVGRFAIDKEIFYEHFTENLDNHYGIKIIN